MARYAYSGQLADEIRAGELDEKIKGILIEVDSYGGSPYAGQEIASVIRRANKPTVTLVRGAAASSAFLVATSSDYVVASKWSELGSIGITASYLESYSKNLKEGFVYQELTSAKYKDVGNPDRPLTAGERALVLQDINQLHDYLVETIGEYRHLDMAAVDRVADGLTFLGSKALEYKFVDKLGDFEDAVRYLERVMGAEATVCSAY